MSETQTDFPWVTFHLVDELYAVSSAHVREMVVMPKIVPVPKTPSHIRGVINLRGQVISVMDLRLRLGLASMMDEIAKLDAMLSQREQDHINWLTELESSVRERREFRLATDPHKCGFGLWYDNYETENRVMAFYLRKFDRPHKAIHGIAQKTNALVAQENFDAAIELIDQTRSNELAEMVDLFHGARELLVRSSREVALVLDFGEMVMAISADSVARVESFTQEEIEEVPSTFVAGHKGCLLGIGKRPGNKTLVQLLNIEDLLGSESSQEVEASAA